MAESHTRKIILLVDDERSVRETIRGFLPDDLYDVLECENARKALEVAAQISLDLMITDAMLPNMKGRDLAARICTIQPKLKVLFVSGYSSDTLINHGIFPPGAYFIGKPIAERILLSKVRNILDQGDPWRVVSGAP
jgi:two-component system, cell cycle sensor histidine kinase and response regulator CckA